jgi:hypothetical protein
VALDGEPAQLPEAWMMKFGELAGV